MYKLYSHPSDQRGRPSRKQQKPSSTIHKNSKVDKKLEVAVDHVLLEHQNKLPKKPPALRVTRRDSYSTISTAPGFPNANLCHVTVDERNGGFIPLEISFPTADADYEMPLLQKANGERLPDSRNVLDFYEDDDYCVEEDIVFVPVDKEVASATSSMDVVRKISSRYTESDDMDDILSKAAARAHSTTSMGFQPRPSSKSKRGHGGTHRAPSMGMDAINAAPPQRRGMHQPSFCVRRAEF